MNKYINECIDNALKGIEDITIEYKIPFKSNVGRFVIHPRKAVAVWTISDFKKVVATIEAANDSYNTALRFHDIFVCLVMELTRKKEALKDILYINDRKAIDDYTKRIIKFNAALSNCGIEAIEANTAPVYKKCTVYGHCYEHGEHMIKSFEGFQFNYFGYTFQCYGNDGKNYVILPSCGIGTPAYETNIKTGHEYLMALIEYINNPAKRDGLIKIENDFNDLMIKSGYTPGDVHKSIFGPSIDVVAGAIEANETINHVATKDRVCSAIAV